MLLSHSKYTKALQDFILWFRTGAEHITDLQGYDHILFLLGLCGVYHYSAWKSLLWLVTAFTLGHSLTLALSVLDMVQVSSDLIEFLIPLSILVTCIYNLATLNRNPAQGSYIRYVMAVLFGCIHGMGFSNYLRALLGGESSVLMPLFSFNLGLEAGQLLILAFIFVLHFLISRYTKVSEYQWKFFLSSAVSGIAFIMTAERLAVFF